MRPAWKKHLLVIAAILVALSITLSTRDYQRPSNLCWGALGAGAPFAWICDTSGGSPISSWGKIDAADYPLLDGLSLVGFLVDIAFYSIALWLIVRVGILTARRVRVRVGRA